MRSGALADLGGEALQLRVVARADVQAGGADVGAVEDGALTVGGGALPRGVVLDVVESIRHHTELRVLAREAEHLRRVEVDDFRCVDLERQGVLDDDDHDVLGEVLDRDGERQRGLGRLVEAHDDVVEGPLVLHLLAWQGLRQQAVGKDLLGLGAQVLVGHEALHAVVDRHILPRGGEVGVRAVLWLGWGGRGGGGVRVGCAIAQDLGCECIGVNGLV
jgi:hypothetical protein